MKKAVKMLPLWLIDKIENHILKDYDRTLKFLTKSNPETLQAISERKALKVFRRAARTVPAYKRFLKTHNLKPRRIKNIEFFDIVPDGQEQLREKIQLRTKMQIRQVSKSRKYR
jgi:phenylacetate-coenzyme A ligase PaaK-like adenylate-forming protein